MKLLIRLGIAVALVAALAVVYWVVQRPAATPAAPSFQFSAEDAVYATDYDEQDLVRVVTYPPDSAPITFVRAADGTNWQIDYPYDAKFITSEVNRAPRAVNRLYVRRVIAEETDDLTQWGLATPKARVEFETTDGQLVEVAIGAANPAGDAHYVQRNGDPRIHLVSDYSLTPLFGGLDSFRDRALPNVPMERLGRMLIRNATETIEIEPVGADDDLDSMFSSFKMVQPYRRPRAVSGDGLNSFAEGLPQFAVERFVDDNPTDYAQYGLDAPWGEFMMADAEDPQYRLHLLFGSQSESGSWYARLPDRASVFEVRADLAFLNTSAFQLVDKFVLLVNIDNLAGLRIEYPQGRYEGAISRRTVEGPAQTADGEPEIVATYRVNDVEIVEKTFKEFYQTVIGLSADRPHPNPVYSEPAPGAAELRITYLLTDGSEEWFELVPLNDDFYAAYRRGLSEFVVSRLQVERMLRSAAQLLQ